MSAVKGANRTILDTEPRVKLDAGLVDGRVKVTHDTYEASTLANPSTIDMGGLIPTNAFVLYVLLTFDALGGSVTLDVGDDEDPNRYLNAVDASSAGGSIVPLVDGQGYQVDMTTASTPDNQLVVTVGGSGTATGTIKLSIIYTHD
jgi:hypothetical protein